MAQDFRRRFRARASLVTTIAVAGFVVLSAASTIAILLTIGPGGGLLLATALAILTLGLILLVLAITTGRNARAIRRVQAAHPTGIAFLARRRPPVVSDMPAYLASKQLDVKIDERWYVALIDDRGISAWAVGRVPRELVLMEWAELGDVLAVRVPTLLGDSRWCVTVDVRPYVTPMTTDIGFASGILTASLGQPDLAEVVQVVEAHRPRG